MHRDNFEGVDNRTIINFFQKIFYNQVQCLLFHFYINSIALVLHFCFIVCWLPACALTLLVSVRKNIRPVKTRNPAIAEGPRDAGVPVEIW